MIQYSLAAAKFSCVSIITAALALITACFDLKPYQKVPQIDLSRF